jgi:hypothetical protein
MNKLFKDMIRGMGYLPGYGYHPGTFVLVFLTISGGLAGIDRDPSFIGFLFGSAAMLTIFLPVYLHGAISRSRDYDRES